ncbi:MAG: hypothetical protein LBD05_00560 [Mycoplasmataceae bacterium]|jgi:hypothetical protein|nr:hypothetical protein [Mycoplasmataceae bacterium]
MKKIAKLHTLWCIPCFFIVSCSPYPIFEYATDFTISGGKEIFDGSNETQFTLTKGEDIGESDNVGTPCFFSYEPNEPNKLIKKINFSASNLPLGIFISKEGQLFGTPLVDSASETDGFFHSIIYANAVEPNIVATLSIKFSIAKEMLCSIKINDFPYSDCRNFIVGENFKWQLTISTIPTSVQNISLDDVIFSVNDNPPPTNLFDQTNSGLINVTFDQLGTFEFTITAISTKFEVADYIGVHIYWIVTQS